MFSIFLLTLIIYANCQTTEFCDNTTCLTTEFDETTIFDTTEKITTAKPTSPTLHEEPYKIDSECLCDLTSEKCDINCCCDSDCSELDQTVFSHCSTDSVKPIKHSGLCFSHQFIYKNNTRYKIKKNEKGLFCIAQDNYPERLQFVNQKVITSLEKFKKVWKRKRHFMWAQKELQEDKKIDNSQNYKYGSALWKYDNITNELNTIKLPIQTTSSFCSSTKEIGYLENIEIECLQNPQIENCETLDYLNAQYYCDSLKLISKPTSFNHSNPEDISLVEVRPIICDKLENCLEVASLPNPIYDKTSKICNNAVQSVFFQLYHNGSNGILDGECVIKFENIRTNIIKQSFKVEYKWVRNDTNVFYRSGAPGYLEGKPIITGKYNEDIKKILVMSKNPKEWLKITKSDIKGNCNGKISILYGENLQTNCFFDFDKNKLKNCQDLNNEIWMILTEAKVNNSDNQKLDMYISSYGDPLNAWVPIHIENTNMDYIRAEHKCSKILSGIHYQILYSYFGPFSSPQVKIIGVTVLFSTDTFKCGLKCRLRLKSTVNYIDVSQKAVNKFSKAPVVKIKLPQDFFYPFSSKCGKITYNHLLITILVLYYLF